MKYEKFTKNDENLTQKSTIFDQFPEGQKRVKNDEKWSKMAIFGPKTEKSALAGAPMKFVTRAFPGPIFDEK